MIHGNSIFSRLVPLAVVIAGGLSGCSSQRPAQTPAPETVRSVSVLPVQRADSPDLLEAVGTIRAAQTSQLASQTTGNFVELRAQEGDRVQRGQVLAIIDDAQPRAAADRAMAAESAALQEVAASDSDLADVCDSSTNCSRSNSPTGRMMSISSSTDVM